MKFPRFVPLLVAWLAMLICVESPAQVKLAGSVFGHVGAVLSGPNHSHVGTGGQAAIGCLACSQYRCNVGFWYARSVPLTAVDAEQGVPAEFRLDQNYPNPFNPVTTISYGLARRTAVSLSVYNILGQHVATLAEGVQNAGFYKVTFDGSRLASGVYWYRLEAQSFVSVRKLVVLK